ncbi:MAG TPA: type II and III secretion system protein family protein [Candidatus Acidoferrales bacterium]|nr:type II and III secretion system protein family protein [Candidatus Acidoferrales bacterium]
MKALTFVAAVVLLGAATIFATRAPARTLAPDRNPPAAPATASASSANHDSPDPDSPNHDSPNQENPPAAQSSTPATSTAAQSVTAGAAPLRVMVGKSLLINTTERLKRVSVTDPTVADALVVTPTQVLVNGLSPGEVSLLIWDELERSRSFDLRVDVDITAASEEMHRLFPNEQISVTPSRSAIVLSGHVTTEDVSKHAGALASAYSKNVVNVLTFGPVGAEEVLLEVKFAEVDRSALTQIGFNLLTTGAGNTIGSTTTGQFGGVATSPISTTIGGSTPTSTIGTTTTTTVSNLLNMFFFNPQVHLGAVIEALKTKNLLQILAEPNLVAVNGKEASFLAGGEFPFPVVQPGAGGLATVTVQFREFGVRLKFTPVIQPNGNIHLRVAPEVSTLDFADAVTVSGTTIPAISTRKADTEFELQDGQSFVIAGLMDNRVTNVGNKIPGLGDIPIIGNFFKSRSDQKSDSELMVLCTVHRISPSVEAPKGPPMPVPNLDKDKFDRGH